MILYLFAAVIFAAGIPIFDGMPVIQGACAVFAAFSAFILSDNVMSLINDRRGDNV